MTGKGKDNCDVCKKDFVHLKRHKMAVHDRLRPWICEVCSKTFNDRSAFGRHCALHKVGDAKNFQCDLCEMKCSTKIYLKSHMKKHTNIYLECPECGKRQKGRYSLNEHMKIHNTAIKCPECDMVFNRTNSLNKHIYNIHKTRLESDRVACKTCNSTFKAKEYLRKHMKYKHSDKESKRWQCDVCLKYFSQQGPLIIHKRIHAEKQFKCNICDDKFVQKVQLKEHTERAHHIGESKATTCPSCDKLFHSSSALRQHQLIHTVEKPYTCECGLKFPILQYMKTHAKRKGCNSNIDVLNIENVKKIECSLCVSSFKYPSELRMHMKIHDGSLLVDCDVCDFKSSNSGNLKVHKKTHQ